MSNDVFENFEDIDLDFDKPTKKDEVVSEETPLSDVKVEEKDNIDFSDLEDIKTPPVVEDKVEELLKADPNTKDNKAADLAAVELKPENDLSELDNLNIEMDTTPAPKAEAPKEKGKRGRKPKEKTTEEHLDELNDLVLEEEKKTDQEAPEIAIKDEEELPPEKPLENRKIYLDPELNIEFLEKTTYQTRSVSRSPEEISELATLIRRQGQLEPIHVAIKNGVKYLVAGFGRVAAMSLLKITIAKAIVYENITEEEILKISSGTNTGRLELREWDKISSVGLYYVKNPTVDVKKFPQIFGFEKTAIYDYITIYNFFKDKKEYIEYFNKIPIPQFMFKALMKNVREFPQIDPKKIIEFVETMLNYEKTTATKFNYELVELVTKEKSKMESIEKEKEFDKLEIEPDGISDVAGKKEVKEKLQDAVVQHKQQNGAKTDLAIAHCLSIVKSLESICSEVDSLQKIEDYKKVIPSNTLQTVCKKISEVQVKISTLV